MTRFDLAGLGFAAFGLLAAGAAHAKDHSLRDYPPYADRCLAGPLSGGLAGADRCRPAMASFGLAGPEAARADSADVEATGSIGPRETAPSKP